MLMKPIHGFPNYLINENGEVSNATTGKVLSPHINVRTGYLCIDLYKNNRRTKFYVHRLVAIHFIDNPDNLPEVNHINGNRQDPSKGNLEWINRLGNIMHAIRTGLRTYNQRLTDDQLVPLLDAVIDGISYQALADAGVGLSHSRLSVRIRGLARKLDKETELGISLNNQRIERAMRNLP